MTAPDHPSRRESTITRRNFLATSAQAGGAAAFLSMPSRAEETAGETSWMAASTYHPEPSQTLDLSPAKWIWYPSERCLPNTFVLFRQTLNLPETPSQATGWILADSRYELRLNGRRIQWGPAPCDPRWLEADPVDLTGLMQKGPQVLGATVLFYGEGDGTWPLGKPGFIFRLDLEMPGGDRLLVASGPSWLTCLARSWRPGQYKRWYLRALQEEFDARLYPEGWDRPEFTPGPDWLPAMELDCPSDKPTICSSYSDLFETQGDRNLCDIRPRSVPLLREYEVPVKQLTESYWIHWKRSPQEYFESLTPGAFEAERTPCHTAGPDGTLTIQLDGARGASLMFELEDQVVGWPYFTIHAPEGTTVELLVHEAHQPGGPALLNTNHHSWSRFICREGENHFQTFDFESLRWLQLHIHGAKGEARIRGVGVRRRIFPWPNEPRIQCSEPKLQRLFDATINTLNNCAQETCVDGMARERQQYSGDCGHQLHALYSAFGEIRLPARYVNTFSQGITLDGYFLDCWPAWDRLARLLERQMHLTKWGPLLDHGVGFNFDCYHHYLYTGGRDALREPYPRLLRFADYLRSILDTDGLLPVENIGIPSVWIDHDAYRKQRHTQCAFNLYAAAMLRHALAPLCEAMDDGALAGQCEQLGRRIQAATVRKFWSPRHGLYVNNLPWLEEEGGVRMCDRSLATAILFDQCPGGNTQNALQALIECPPELGFSYPANAGWRLWALAKEGRTDVVLKDLREQWATMNSVILNNTLQENWSAPFDTGAQWSHCPVAPVYVLFMSIAGIQPLEAGFKRCEIRPQLADLEELKLTAYTVQGPIEFHAQGKPGNRRITLSLPEGMQGELVLAQSEKIELPLINQDQPIGCARYRMTANKLTFTLVNS
ncbi:MAG: alpha-L-rhamnosidase C-terminal domain-containing protein [bacterium]